MQDDRVQQKNWSSTWREKHINKNKRDLMQVDEFLHKR